MGAEDRSDAIGGDFVDEIPPGAFDDHLLVERHRLGRLERTRLLDARQRDGAIELFAKLCAIPYRADFFLPLFALSERQWREDVLADCSDLRSDDAVVRHL